MKLEKNTMMRQCKIERVSDEGTIRQVAWIPSVASVIGKTVTLKAEDHRFFWTVIEASDSEKTYAALKKRVHHHR